METALFLLQVKELHFLLHKLDSDVISLWKKKFFSGLKYFEDFSGGAVVNSPPSNSRDTGLTLGQGTEIPHALRQLSPGASKTAATKSGTQSIDCLSLKITISS